MAPIDYLAELGQQRCRQILHIKFQTTCRVDPVINCWLATGSKNSDGYAQIWAKKNSAITLGRTGRSSQTAFLLHVVAHLASRGQNVPAGCQVSHLCDQRHCFNPDHLFVETPLANNNRKGCPGPLFCPDHGHELLNLCSHQPQCIRPPRLDIVCCLTLQRDPDWRNLPLYRTASVSTVAAGPSDSHASGVTQSSARSVPRLCSNQEGITPSAALRQMQRETLAVSTQYSGANEVDQVLMEGLL